MELLQVLFEPEPIVRESCLPESLPGVSCRIPEKACRCGTGVMVVAIQDFEKQLGAALSDTAIEPERFDLVVAESIRIRI